jgi:hypothetical protein
MFTAEFAKGAEFLRTTTETTEFTEFFYGFIGELPTRSGKTFDSSWITVLEKSSDRTHIRIRSSVFIYTYNYSLKLTVILINYLLYYPCSNAPTHFWFLQD